MRWHTFARCANNDIILCLHSWCKWRLPRVQPRNLNIPIRWNRFDAVIIPCCLKDMWSGGNHNFGVWTVDSYTSSLKICSMKTAICCTCLPHPQTNESCQALNSRTTLFLCAKAVVSGSWTAYPTKETRKIDVFKPQNIYDTMWTQTQTQTTCGDTQTHIFRWCRWEGNASRKSFIYTPQTRSFFLNCQTVGPSGYALLLFIVL